MAPKSGYYNGNGNGIFNIITTLDAWRNRPCGVVVLFLGTIPASSSWAQQTVNNAVFNLDGPIAGCKSRGIVPVLSWPIVPGGNAAQFSQLVNGNFDTHIDWAAQRLFDIMGTTPMYVRFGWESNINRQYPFAADYDRANNYVNYIAACRRTITRFRAKYPNVISVASYQKECKYNSNQYYDPDLIWVGDSYVDVVALDYYDGNPYSTPTNLNTVLNATVGNGYPKGIASWKAYAVSKNKPFAIDEWGIRLPSQGGGGDNELFIQRMWDYLHVTLGSSLLYESYFLIARRNDNEEHTLYPTTQYNGIAGPVVGVENPSATSYSTAKYKALWNIDNGTPAPGNLGPMVDINKRIIVDTSGRPIRCGGST